MLTFNKQTAPGQLNISNPNRPLAEDATAARRRQARFDSIMSNLRSGQEVSRSDKDFLRRYFPESYTTAREVEAEARRLEIEVRAARSEDEARRILRNVSPSFVHTAAALRVSNNIGSMEFQERERQNEEDECTVDVSV